MMPVQKVRGNCYNACVFNDLQVDKLIKVVIKTLRHWCLPVSIVVSVNIVSELNNKAFWIPDDQNTRYKISLYSQHHNDLNG